MRRFVFALALTLTSPTSHGAPTSICPASEEAIFTCSLGHKSISICTYFVNSEKEPHARYILGNSKVIDLSIPNAKTIKGAHPYFGVIPYARSNTAYGRFQNGAYEYIVYSSQGYSHHDISDPNSTYTWLYEGVLVTLNDSIVSNFPCIESNSPDGNFQNFEQATKSALAAENDPAQSKVEGILNTIDLNKPLTRR